MAATIQYRPSPALSGGSHAANGLFTSPTESEFSESYRDGRDAVQDWDEARVADWLRSIKCGQYADVFVKNHINGENLMDIDQATLKEMGVTKIGDRVRIGSQAKNFRNHVYKRTSKRSMNRQSLALLDSNAQQMSPPSSGSPRHLYSTRGVANQRSERRSSRQLTDSTLIAGRTVSRPNSPMVDQENHGTVRARYNTYSPMETTRKELNSSYFANNPPSARPINAPRTAGLDTPQTARLMYHLRTSPSADNLGGLASALPNDKMLIKVIFENGRSSVINIEGCRTAEEIVRHTLRKGTLNETHFRSYCFYVLDGTDPNPTFCRRLGDTELVKLCQDGVRTERGRLILRKIHAGEPDGEQLRAAARIAETQQPEPPAIEVQPPYKSKSQLKLEKLTGEPLAAVSYPMSPGSEAVRQEYFKSQNTIQRNASTTSTASARAERLKDFYGARPPTELITQDLSSYFPEVAKEDMDRTVRMSIHRSQRLSRAVRTMSMASNFSVLSTLRDAPPLPTIADSWLKGDKNPRPLSVMRLARNDSSRLSVTSSMLSRLDEESTYEPDRKSYVSFSADSGSDTTTSQLHTNDGDSSTQAYFDDSTSITTPVDGDSLNSRLSRYIAEDGEELDEELIQHLEASSWDNVKYMKGAMIGQGSFGTVFLALHSITGELMAVKQVEMPTNQSTAMDSKKKNMIEALKHEISLLRDLKHENIVQYLGSNSDEDHLNIFLEYVAGGSVATMLNTYGSFMEGLIQNFVRQILQGLIYLHSKDIIHRDIKGANILVDNKGTVKISDFGISKRVEASTLLHPTPGLKRGGPRVSLQGSVFWMAPEVVRQTAYTKAADIWSLGCLIVEMFTGSHPHPNCTQLQAIFKIGSSGSNAEAARPDMPPAASETAKEFLGQCFELEHERRPTAEDLYKSSFVDKAAAAGTAGA